MNRALLTKRNVAILVGCAALVATVVARYVRTHAPRYYFEVAMHSSQPGSAQLFYDIGYGLNERESASLRLREGESLLRFPLPLGNYRAFRFDPINRGYCKIIVRKARIVDLAGRLVRDFSPEDFIPEHDVSAMEIVTGEVRLDLAAMESDPHLSIKLAGPFSLARPSLAPFTIRTFLLWLFGLTLVGLSWLLFMPRGWTANALLLSMLVAFVYLGARSRFLAPFSFDEQGFIWFGWLLKNGSIPYRDFFEPKPPVIFLANALGLVFGLKDYLFRIVPTTVAISSILIFYLAMIKRLVVPWLAILLTAQLALWLLGGDFHDTGLNDAETYGFAFCVFGFSLGSLSTSLRSGAGRIAFQVLGGICFGLAVLSKELFVLSVLPAWLLVARRQEDGGRDWRQLLISAAGGVAVGISFLIYLIAHSALGGYLDVIQAARLFAASYYLEVGRFPRVSGMAVLWPSWKMLNEQLYNFGHLAFVLALWAVLLILFRRRSNTLPKRLELTIAIVAVFCGMVAVSIGHCFWRHYFLMGTTGLLLLSVLGVEVLSGYLEQRRPWVSALSFIGLFGMFLFVAWSPTGVMLAGKYEGYRLPWEPLVTETIERHSKPGDYILETGGYLIYPAMDRKYPFAVTPEFAPYLRTLKRTMRMESLREELEKNLPRVCSFAGGEFPEQKIWREHLYDPLLLKYHYVKVNDELWYLPDAN
jgi:hypothetical protein